MNSSPARHRLERWQRYLNWLAALAVLLILGSCVGEIDDVGGGRDAHRDMAGIFFFHLFLLVPCLLGAYVFINLRLEKLMLSRKEIDELNQAHMVNVKANLKSYLGPVAPLVERWLNKRRQ